MEYVHSAYYKIFEDTKPEAWSNTNKKVNSTLHIQVDKYVYI